MTTFIKNIGNCRWNGFGADLYENNCGSAYIAFNKNTKELPPQTCIRFENLDEALAYINRHKGSSGLNTLRNVLNTSRVR
jgi:hypothetical protein